MVSNILLNKQLLETTIINDGLIGASLPLALAEFCKNTPQIHLIITLDNLSAQQLFDEMCFFLGNEQCPEILLFPDWETLPYDQFSPHQDIISERLRILNRVQQASHAIVITAVSTIMHRLAPPPFLLKHAISLKESQQLNIQQFRQHLINAGYHHVNKVLEHGEFAIRGSIIDLYPMGNPYPFRIELFDDEIQSLRSFDPDNQLTIAKITAIEILPAHEFSMDEEGISEFRRNFRETFPGNPSHCPIYEAISQGQTIGGIEYYLPLFFSNTVSFFDYLPKSAKISLIGKVNDSATVFWDEIKKRYEQRSYDITKPILSPEKCFLSPTELTTLSNQFAIIKFFQELSGKKAHTLTYNVNPGPELFIERQSSNPLQKLIQYLNQHDYRHLIVVESAGRREVLLELLNQGQISPKIQDNWNTFLADDAKINITIGNLSAGAELPDNNTSLIVESQIFSQAKLPQSRKSQKNIDPDLIIRDLAEIRIGTPVVHINFGVGRYQGLQLIESNGITNEFLMLVYEGGDKIYVPITSLHYINRYTGADPDKAPLHRLGSDLWQKEKKKAQEKINDVAIELLDLYAKREADKGYAYQFDEEEYKLFANGFSFDETNDQLHAIEEIIRDMKSERPMDRLICGDVGFGKTEVAMRAAFIAAHNNKQVCVLVPTTLLATQHFETFQDRFADFPIKIELLSRFRSAKESEKVIESLKDGRTDIVIGTHKLFQKNITFKRLGLLIIDEEHRFGVKQKEHMKSLKTHVDILSMTATPIPRTLNMAMSGIRDISLIATPPAKRLAIKTFWQERHKSTIREAILREILRGGQVFFLHNDVQSIASVCQELEELVPEASIKFAHGQMRERELERIMSDFYHHRFNVLVCTTIIETGIDIPTANTIIIDKAEKFGLAQLHQLRGRVGRSHHQAYAYLLTPNSKLLTSDACKRLEAIVSLEDLGAGFTLATHDLEIRGAGEFLGEEQSGNMHAIGFNLYMELLERSVECLKSGKVPELAAPMNQGPEINFNICAIIPESYVNDIHTRLVLYKQISNAANREQLHQLQIELIDRFGMYPESVKHLFLITELKWTATNLGVTVIQAGNDKGKIEFNEQPNINAATLIKLIQLHPKRYQLSSANQLKFTFESQKAEEKIHEINQLFEKIKN